MNIIYTPAFIRQYKKLSTPLKVEAKEKIELFKSDPAHNFLRTHKLKGILKDRWSFSVNYSYRIVFRYLNKETAIFLAIGNHDVYK